MKPPVTWASALAFLAPLSFATDLDLTVQSGGSSSIQVLPGASVPFVVRGELTDQSNEGLAGFAFDLTFDGGAIFPLTAPSTPPMDNFVTPLGLNNPGGYGGTFVGGDLIQVGGMQNTIGNFLAIPPTGSAIVGVAWPGNSEVLASGSVTMPMIAGNYTISVENAVANVIRQGENGTPFWACDEAGEGTITQLSVEVLSVFSGDIAQTSLAAPTTQTLSLDAGASQAGRAYLVLGSISGNTPGIPVGALLLPLNFDFYLTVTLTSPNLPPLSNSLGFLNGSGQATAGFTLPSGLGPAFIGLTVNHAYVLVAPEDYVSNPVTLEITS